jgi:exonuclease III
MNYNLRTTGDPVIEAASDDLGGAHEGSVRPLDPQGEQIVPNLDPRSGGATVHLKDISRRRVKAKHTPGKGIVVATWNCRGLLTKQDGSSKLSEVARRMLLWKWAILGIQETHVATIALAHIETMNGRIWGFTNPGTSLSAGTTILINRAMFKSLERKDIVHEVLIPGRAHTISIPWEGGKLTVANAYFPNSERAMLEFVPPLIRCLQGRRIDALIGDFNHCKSELDRWPMRAPSKEIHDALSRLERELHIRDGWRDDNPLGKSYTYAATHLIGSYSRLDKIMIRQTDQNIWGGWGVGVMGDLSDHQPVFATLAKRVQPFIGKGLWRLDIDLVNDETFMTKARGLVENCDWRQASERNRDPMKVWLKCKNAVRELAIGLQNARKRKATKLASLKSRLHDLYNREQDELPIEEIEQLKHRIDLLSKATMERAVAHANSRSEMLRERPNKYWLNLQKTRQSGTVFDGLKDDQGELQRTTKQMAKIAHEFHEKVNAKADMSEERQHAIHRVLENVPKLPGELKPELAKSLTLEEVLWAIRKSEKRTAPGQDGLMYELYKALAKDERSPIVRVLMRAFNFTFKTPVPREYVKGIMCFIHKKKSRDEIVNYRPISLLNSDFKIQQMIMANRMGRAIPAVLDEAQAGFVPGRSILGHVRLAQLLTEATEKFKINGCMVALDQEKAYDRIDHEYLWQVLEAYGLPHEFNRMMKNLYGSASTSVLVNGVVPSPFKVRRGVRQGDPTSCLLFNLAIEPLAQLIREPGLRGIQIEGVKKILEKLYADDTLVNLAARDSVPLLTSRLDLWCLASTAKFNINKTELLPLGPLAHRERVARTRTLGRDPLPESEVLATDGSSIRVLGGQVGYRMSDENVWSPFLKKTRGIFTMWAGKRLTLEGKKTLLRTLVLPSAHYLVMTNPPGKDTINEINKSIHSFLWGGKKKGLVAWNTMHLPIEYGGFGIPSLDTKVKAAKVWWGMQWLTEPKPHWAQLADALHKLAYAETFKRRGMRDADALTFAPVQEHPQPKLLGPLLKPLVEVAKEFKIENKLSTRQLSSIPVWESKIVDSGRVTATVRVLKRTHKVYQVGDLERAMFESATCTGRHYLCVAKIKKLQRSLVAWNNSLKLPTCQGELLEAITWKGVSPKKKVFTELVKRIENDRPIKPTQSADEIQRKLVVESRWTVKMGRIWESTQHESIRLEIRQFLWRAMHDKVNTRSRLHEKKVVPDPYCSHCGAVETLEHIISECKLLWREEVWKQACQLLKDADEAMTTPTFAQALVAGLGKQTPKRRRLGTIVITEAMYTIWILRCRRDLGEQVISVQKAKEVFWHRLGQRARNELYATVMRNNGVETSRREAFRATWKGIASLDRGNLNWTARGPSGDVLMAAPRQGIG